MSVYQRKDGRWVREIDLGKDQSGKRLRRFLYGKSKEEVTHLTFGCLYRERISLKINRPTTLRTYKIYLGSYLASISDLPAHKVSVASLRSNLETQLSISTLRRVLGVVLATLRFGRDKYGIEVDRLTKQLPTAPKKKPRSLTKEELRRFLETAKTRRHYEMYLTSVCCGLGIGELLGLTWQDIDFDRRLISVTKQRISLGSQLQPGFHELKTKARYRTLPMPEILRVELERIRKTNGPVFIDKLGKTPTAKNMNEKIKTVCRRAGIQPISFHALRHTAISLALDAGCNVLEVQKLAGHSTAMMTLEVYGHLFPSTARTTTDKIEAQILQAIDRQVTGRETNRVASGRDGRAAEGARLEIVCASKGQLTRPKKNKKQTQMKAKP